MATVSDFLLKVQVAGTELIDKLKKSVDDTSKSFTTGADAATKFNEKTKLTGDGAAKAGEAIKGLSDHIMKAADGTTVFGEGAGGLIGKLGPLGVVAGSAVVAMGALFARAVNLADKLGDVSDATGISAGRLVNFKESLLLAGGNAESMEKLASKLAVSIGQAGDGNEKARYSFKQLGVELGDANGKLRSADDLFPEVIAGLKQIEDPALRLAAGVELMGKSFAKIDVSKINVAKDVFKDEQAKQLGKYRDAIDELSNTIENKLITSFGNLAIAINKAFSGPATTMEKFKAGLLGMLPGGLGQSGIDSIKGDIAARLAVEAEGKRMAGSVAQNQAGAKISTGETGPLALTDAQNKIITDAKITTELMKQQDSIAQSYARRINDTISMRQQEGDILKASLMIDQQRDAKLADINAQIKKESAVPEKERDLRVTGAIVAQLREQAVEVKRNAELSKEAKTDEIQQLQKQKDLMADIQLLNTIFVQDAQVKELANQNNLIGLYGDELKIKQELMKIENERVNAVLAANNKLAALGKNVTQQDDERANREIAQANKVANEKVTIAQDGLAREQATRENANLGAAKAFDDIAKSMKPMMNAQNAVNAMFSSMGSAIDKFVDTGKFSFGDLARSMIQDILKIELKAQASKIFAGIFGSDGMFGDIFGSIFGKAAGGDVNANQPYVVGEKGPELFMPKQSGTIIPNGGLMAGGPVTNNVTHNTYNVSAIDSRSVASFFAENRKTMLGTMQLAQKELPYSNR